MLPTYGSLVAVLHGLGPAWKLLNLVSILFCGGRGPVRPGGEPMKKRNWQVDAEALRRVENFCRSRILQDPCDTLPRGTLAWCLFLQALHQAGRESVLNLLPDLTLWPEGEQEPFEPQSERGAEQLLAECLRLTEIALSLTEPGELRTEMERLRSLARLSAGEQPVYRAEQQMQQILHTLMDDVKAANPSQFFDF